MEFGNAGRDFPGKDFPMVFRGKKGGDGKCWNSCAMNC